MVPIINNINFYKSPYDFLRKDFDEQKIVVKKEISMCPSQYINERKIQTSKIEGQEGSKRR